MDGIKLGQKVRDVVTGFVGIADCRMEWLNGCVRVSVQPVARTDKKDGTQYVQDAKSFDEEQLEVVVAEPIALPNHRTRRAQTGGGRPDPPRARSQEGPS